MDQSDGSQAVGTAVALAVAKDQRYHKLVATRSRFAWTLTGAMLAIFFGYILLIAFEPELLARPIGRGVTSIGIPLGLGVILAGIALTAIYVRRANTVFDGELEILRKEHGA